MIAKVADFGLARDINQDEIYNMSNRTTKLPWKWLSPESLFDSMFTSTSDVYVEDARNIRSRLQQDQQITRWNLCGDE